MQNMARQIRMMGDWQRHLLPRKTPDPPGWQIAAHYAVGAYPGGDYYDFLTLPDGRILFLIGDASDEGGPACALVALVRVMMHSCPLNSGVGRLPFCPMSGEVVQAPHIILGNLNRVLVENSLEEQHMTVLCGLLSPLEGELHYANAGHLAPRWWHARTRTVELLRSPTGLPLGLDVHASYHHQRVAIEPGDVLLAYSDGITTALNKAGYAFGQGRLDDALRDLAPQGAQTLKNGLVARLSDFLDERDSQDDVTLLVFERQT